MFAAAASLPSCDTRMACSTFHNIIDPTSLSSVVRNAEIPVCCPIPNGKLQLGTLISICGIIKSNGRSFRVDFMRNCGHCGDSNKDDSILFHFNPRIGGTSDGRNVVVMNSFCDGYWREEERNMDSFPFACGTQFRLMILVEAEMFKIAVNEQHLYEFKHRCDFNEIGHLHIEGDLTLDLIEFRTELRYLNRPNAPNMSSPEAVNQSQCSLKQPTQEEPEASTRSARSVDSPSVPFLEYEPNLGRPCDIYISGMLPTHIQENFVINLANTVEEQQSTTGIINIPVHISIRPDINAIVRNTLTNGIWGEEELQLQGPSQLIPGTHFDLIISNRADKCVLSINGQPAFEYKHRHDPKTIDALQINGCVVLNSVRFDYKF
ncbi:Galectin-4 [Sarcoptes scabiei]|nr:Galectin-4 [Sarcoptes scabiei]